MSHDTRLLRVDAEDLLSEIRTRVEKNLRPNGQVAAVQFYPSSPNGSSRDSLVDSPTGENFSEETYLEENPDIAGAIDRGDVRSGFEHWTKHGKLEGRAFPVKSEKPVRRLVSRLKSLDGELDACIRQIGEQPPVPGTVRGAVGRWAIAVMRRMLWWYSRPLTIFAGVVERHFSEQTAFFEYLGHRQEQFQQSISSLQGTLAGVDKRLEAVQAVQKQVEAQNVLLEASFSQFRERGERLEALIAGEKATRESLGHRVVEAQATETARVNLQVGGLDIAINEFRRKTEAALSEEMAARESLEHRVVEAHAAQTARVDRQVGQLEIAIHEFHRTIEATLSEEKAVRESLEHRVVEAQAAETTRIDRQVSQLQIAIHEFHQKSAAGFSEANAVRAVDAARLDQQVGHIEARVREFYQKIEAGLVREMAAREDLDHRLTVGISQMQAAETALIGRLEIGARESYQRIETGLAGEMAAREALEQRLAAASEQLHLLQANWGKLQRYAEQTKAELTFQGARLRMLLEESRKCLPKPYKQEQLQRMATAADEMLDALYLSFEDTFRGPREEIKQRQSVYVRFITAANAGTQKRPVLDLGAGRGEWLEVLHDHQLTARGIDQNRAMVELCQSRGLDVANLDALEHLSSLPDNSVGAITAFHIVEHLPFDTIITLLEQILRVLQPGGVVILETPNPTNLMVASHNFYLDPTHIRPLPAAMMRFFVEAKGFCNAEVLELHPYPAALVPPIAEGDAASKRLNDLLCGPQDYGLIARRPQFFE